MEFNSELIISYIAMYGFNIIGSLVIFFVGKWLAKVITSLFVRAMKKSNLDETLRKFLDDIVYGVLIVVVVLAALNNLGINTTSFVAILGAAGLAVGLAFKDTFSNIGAGVLLIVFRPFTVGNFIQAAGESGVVEEINLFSVMMKTGDNKQIIIPNSSIIGGNITNFSAKETRRVDFVFAIGYDDDLKLAKTTLEEIINEDERVLKDPAAFVAVNELADSSVNFVVRAWVKSSDYWGVYFDTHEAVKVTFDAEGISIPFPQQDVHMHQVA